jgi:mono/diheme cytochrome c family protein
MRWSGFILGVVATLVVTATAGLAWVYTGSYDVSATGGHGAAENWLLGTTMEKSVASRASAIAEPAAFTPADVAAGAVEFKAMCQQCHGGPGAERAEWASGMVPRAPDLARSAAEWRPREIFWIVKNGIKMTGMPAFGADHDDDALWSIAAFVKALPTMSASQYAEFKGEHKLEAEEGGHHDAVPHTH